MTASTFYEKYYAQLDRVGWEWRELGGRIKAKNIKTVAGHLDIGSVIDIGCGTGAVLAHLAHEGMGELYYALDVAENAIAAVRQRTDIPNLAGSQVFDGLRIPYGDHQFDLAVLSHVVEHLAHPGPLLCEAARVARYVCVEVPLEDNVYTRLKVHVFKSRYREDIGHIQWFSLGSFRGLLKSTCGLRIITMKTVYVPDEVYFFRKQGSRRLLTSLALAVRKLLRMLPDRWCTRFLTDHCIALVCHARVSPSPSATWLPAET
jgi:SAM-dependent methyltransferase